MALLVFVWGLAFLAPGTFCGAQGAEKAAAPVPAKGAQTPGVQEQPSDDPLGRSTPQGTVMGFIKATSHEDYERAQSISIRSSLPRRLLSSLRSSSFFWTEDFRTASTI